MNSTEKGVTFLRRILTGGSHFYVEKWPRGQFSTGVTSLRYTGIITRLDPGHEASAPTVFLQPGVTVHSVSLFTPRIFPYQITNYMYIFNCVMNISHRPLAVYVGSISYNLQEMYYLNHI
jgi:hypothetical protein